MFSVDAFVREEINKIDSSDLFLDVFVNDDFTHFGGFDDLLNEDAVVGPQQQSSVVNPIPSPLMIAKSRFVRSIKSEKLNSTKSREQELLEKLKHLTEESEKKGFDPQKFTELLKEFSNSKNVSNTLVTDKLVQLIYKFLQENKEKQTWSTMSTTPPTKVKIRKPECVNASDILGLNVSYTVSV